jgi:hypothetical protein
LLLACDLTRSAEVAVVELLAVKLMVALGIILSNCIHLGEWGGIIGKK